MANQVVDYDPLAGKYDAGRELSDDKVSCWLQIFSDDLWLTDGSSLLDIGCGTGRFAVALAKRGCHVTGVDPSHRMLAVARGKSSGAIRWVRGRGERLPFRSCSFDACLASQVVHHFADKLGAIAEAFRVLRPGARLGFRLSSHQQLESLLEYRFFARALEIDRARLPDLPVLIGMLEQTGFTIVRTREVTQQVADSAEAYLNKLEQKYSSVLTLLTAAEFQQGLRRARKQLRGVPVAESDLEARITFLVAAK